MHNAYIGIMSYIRYKKFGMKKYAYEITSYWDTKKKKPRQKVKYLGVVGREGKIVEKKTFARHEKLILDFGDTYLLYEFMKTTKIAHMIEDVFGGHAKKLICLLCYRICHASAMRYAKLWYEGNVCRVVFPGVDISSQRISDLLCTIGDEQLQRTFFSRYLSSLEDIGGGVVIDTTALPNHVRLPFNAWGYHDGEIEKQIRFLFVIDKDTSSPLFFRYLPGNIVDVSSLSVTMEELAQLGIRHSFVLIDAGFFSEDNVRALYGKKIDFLSRLPSSRTLYKELIKKEARILEKFTYTVRYGKRVLFIKRTQVNLYGKKAYAYLVLDPERKGREIRKLLTNALDGDAEDIEYRVMKQGIMILISSLKIDTNDIVPWYYLRQTVEMLFGFSKDDLKLIPLRIHKEETLRGYLLLMFIALVVFLRLKKAIGEEHTVEEILFAMRNVKCKVYEHEVLIQELTKQQKNIADILHVLVPKKLGI